MSKMFKRYRQIDAGDLGALGVLSALGILVALIVLVAALLAALPAAAAQPGHDMSAMPGMGAAPAPSAAGAAGGDAGKAPMEHAGAADAAMSHEHMGMGPHMKMTAPRPRTAEDQRRADAVAGTLGAAIARYRDYRVALADGYAQYLPNVRQPRYHFTNWGNAYLAQSSFDPARPTSLLYKPVAGGFELVGAMYTAPRRFTEAQLDERVPLAVAAWHQHVNVCLPPKSGYATADWHKFGFAGAIAGESECQAAGGIFHPVIFGWMVHVYPFEQDPAKIWAH
jgi:hypothetical protein